MRIGLNLILLIMFLFPANSCEAQEVENLMTNRDKREMVRLINQARQKGTRCGKDWYKPVPPLKWDDRLEAAAADKSQDMYRNKYFDHVSPDGLKLNDLMKKVNYRWAAIGENLAMGPTSVEITVETWLKSEGHCRNIMKSQFTHFGAAQYGIYWTQIFAKPHGH
jgi:uncharacterized protein YkwD